MFFAPGAKNNKSKDPYVRIVFIPFFPWKAPRHTHGAG
jgi:hypothetical protein